MYIYVIISIFMYITLCMKQLFKPLEINLQRKIQDTNTMLVWFQLRYRRWHWYYESFGYVPPKLLQFQVSDGGRMFMIITWILMSVQCYEQDGIASFFGRKVSSSFPRKSSSWELRQILSLVLDSLFKQPPVIMQMKKNLQLMG